MRQILLLFIASAVFLAGCNTQPKKSGSEASKGSGSEKSASVTEMNKLTASEAAQGWILLFNGNSGEGWRGVNKTEFPAGWIVEDGSLKCVGSGRGVAGAVNGGDIIYAKRLFSNSDLKLER